MLKKNLPDSRRRCRRCLGRMVDVQCAKQRQRATGRLRQRGHRPSRPILPGRGPHRPIVGSGGRPRANRRYSRHARPGRRPAGGARLIDDFEHSSGFAIVARLAPEAEIAAAIDARAAAMVLVVPENFSRRLKGGSAWVERSKPATVQLIADGRASNSAQVLIGYATAILERYNGEWLAAHGRNPVPSAIITTSWFNSDIS